MGDSETTSQITVFIGSDSDFDTYPEDLERFTQSLHREILSLDVESVDLLKGGEPPSNTKVGDPISWGAIIVTLLATGGVITTLINAIQAWLTQYERRSITLEINGDKLQITGISSEEQKRLIDAWIDRNTKS
jgi:hypothetical protein